MTPEENVSQTERDREEAVEHDLKCQPPYFQSLIDGSKTFEIRFNDRHFGVGDVLKLREWNAPTNDFPGEYTGRYTYQTVSYVTDYNQMDGYVVLGLSRESALAAREAATVERCAKVAMAVANKWKVHPHSERTLGAGWGADEVASALRATLKPETKGEN